MGLLLQRSGATMWKNKPLLFILASALVMTLTIIDNRIATTHRVLPMSFSIFRNLLDYHTSPCSLIEEHLFKLKHKFGLRWKPHIADRVVLVGSTFGHAARPPPPVTFPEDDDENSEPCLSRSSDLNDVFSYWNFPYDMLHDPRYESEDLRFLTEPTEEESSRGAAYWFWKPLLIQHHLESVPDGAFVVYVDMDLEETSTWVPHLLEEMHLRGADLAMLERTPQHAEPQEDGRQQKEQRGQQRLHDQGHKQQPHSNSDARRNDDEERYHGAAGYVILRKNPTTSKIISDWVSAVTQLQSHKLTYHSKDQQNLLSVTVENFYGAPEQMDFKTTLVEKEGGWSMKTYAMSTVPIDAAQLLLGNSNNNINNHNGPVNQHVALYVDETSGYAEASLTSYQENLALSHPVIASTSCRGPDGNLPSHLTDANVKTFHHSCRKGLEWIIVDLECMASVHDVMIYNRANFCCPERLRNFVVEVLDEKAHVVSSRVYPGAAKEGERIVLEFNDNDNEDSKGRFVRVRLLEEDWFHLAEVEVHGVALTKDQASANSAASSAAKATG